MPKLPNGVFELGVLLAGLARNLAHQQIRLDHEYEKQLKEFAPVLKLAQALGYEELARTIAPSPLNVGKTEISVGLHVTRSRETEFSLNVRPINVGFSRRYRYSQFVTNTLQLTVQSFPSTTGRGPKSPPA